MAGRRVVKAVDIVSTPALQIAEFFGTASSGDTRLSACVATVAEPCGEAHQVPEFDEYVLVTAGRVELTRGGLKHTISKGEGVMLKAGECVTWTWNQACQYLIVCLPSQEADEENEADRALDSGNDSLNEEIPTAVPLPHCPSQEEKIRMPTGQVPPPPTQQTQARPTQQMQQMMPPLMSQPGQQPTQQSRPMQQPTQMQPTQSPQAYAPTHGSMPPRQYSPSKEVNVLPNKAKPGEPANALGPIRMPMGSVWAKDGAQDPPSRQTSPTEAGSAYGSGLGMAPAGQWAPSGPYGQPKQTFQTYNSTEAPQSYAARSEMDQTETETYRSGTLTPTAQMVHNLPDMIPDSNGSLMNRASSLSAFDQLLTTEQLNELRKETELQDDRPARYGARHLNTPIVVVASEMNPWSKTGGLAMVAGSYAYEFAVRGHRTMAIAPAYGNYDNTKWVGKTRVWLDGCEHEVNFLHQRQEYGAGKGCDYIFVDHSCYRRPAGLYGDPSQGGEYSDNLMRFALLCVAAAEAPLILNLGGSTYGQEVMFIANDWQTGLLPVYLKYKYKRHNTYMKAKCMYVLHNMGYQGKYRMSKFPVDGFLGLPSEAETELVGEDMHYGADCYNLLAGGIRLADRVVTVSPNYAKEIQTPEGGLGLHPDLQKRAGNGDLVGILNGISDEWNPAIDPNIAMNYTLENMEQGKAACKAALQQELGLHQDPNACLIGFCGRLCYQKGIHIIAEIIPWMMEETGNGVTGRCQIIMMGKGESDYESQLRSAESQHRGKVCGFVGFKAEVEHRMMAACDLLLMPSQYEPCGLPQMYAQMYGCLPVCHETGGLRDSVKGLWDEWTDCKHATGFLFGGFEENALKERLYMAMNIFQHKRPLFKLMQTNAMTADYYWPQAIDEYEKHIDQVLG